MTTLGTVHVIDDDSAVRTSLKRSLVRRGYTFEGYDCAENFLETYQPEKTKGCLVLDVRMPGMSGLELQQEINAKNIKLPIIFITGHGDVPMSVRAMKSGAVEFLEKPYSVESLLEHIEEAITLSEKQISVDAEQDEIIARYARLTKRESEVMILLVAGGGDSSNKIVARKLGIGHRTVDDHRARVMGKMQARSLAELVSMAKICGIYKP